jgi:hypothetical protein
LQQYDLWIYQAGVWSGNWRIIIIIIACSVAISFAARAIKTQTNNHEHVPETSPEQENEA